jgi:hypothetical protein
LLAIGAPFRAGRLLALGAVAVATRVVRDELVPASIASFDVRTASRGAAREDIAQDTPMLERHRATSRLEVFPGVCPHDIRHLE